MAKKRTSTVFRVFHLIRSGKKKFRRVYFDVEFANRAKARNWCRNNPAFDRHIEHPDGTVEPFQRGE